MDTFFPFGLPLSTAFYAILYVATWVLHAVFMNYVLAGSLFVAWTELMPGGGETPRNRQPLAALLRDWLPFVLSAAVTAGVAPLLFVQLLYPRHFYTANLLLSWRWMVLIPALIAAFYLLYLLKSETFAGWSRGRRSIVAVASAGCFVFTAFCWTANHLLSAYPGGWADVYVTESVAHLFPALFPRLAAAIGGSFATLGVFAGWQLYSLRQREGSAIQPAIDVETRRITIFTAGGLVIAAGMTVLHLQQMPDKTTDVVISPFALPWMIAIAAGALLLAITWCSQLSHDGLCPRLLSISTTGCGLMLLGVGVLREAIRLSRFSVSRLYERHESAFEIGGFGLFVVIAAVNIGLIAWCVRLVRAGLRH